MYLDTLFSVEGKTALITGAGTGIGRMIAEALANAGARVLIASRKRHVCEQAANEINQTDAPGRAEGLEGDVGSEHGVRALGDALRDRVDHLDILVNNAGRTWGARFEEFPYRAWADVLSVNVTGPFLLTQCVLPLLKAAAARNEPARVVNLGSIAGSQPIVDQAYSYAASKAAIHHLTRVLAKELAPHKITVNALAPGLFESRMTAFSLKDDANREAISARIPSGRIGQAQDIAAAILYLCGPGGAYTTGAILPIDGGMGLQTGPALFSDP